MANNYSKGLKTPSYEETQIKTNLRYHLTPAYH